MEYCSRIGMLGMIFVIAYGNKVQLPFRDECTIVKLYQSLVIMAVMANASLSLYKKMIRLGFLFLIRSYVFTKSVLLLLKSVLLKHSHDNDTYASKRGSLHDQSELVRGRRFQSYQTRNPIVEKHAGKNRWSGNIFPCNAEMAHAQNKYYLKKECPAQDWERMFDKDREGTTNNDAMSTVTSLDSASISSSISPRMKKYGLVDINEIKRTKFKQQQHRGDNQKGSALDIRDNSLKANNISNSNHPNTTKSYLAASVNSGLTKCMAESNRPEVSSSGRGSEHPTRIRTTPLHVQIAVDEFHRWLFTEGERFKDVEMFLTQYSLYMRERFGIPLDRLCYGGIGLHPKPTAYMWKWETDSEFTHSEMPPEVFARRNEIFSPDEPFCVMEQGRTDHVRIKDTDSYIPPDTSKWFRGLGYKDYFALPDIHRGFSKGGLAWATKYPGGFCDNDILFFKMTQAAITTIMRLHTNDLVLSTLTDRMESEINDRIKQLDIANRKLEEAKNTAEKKAQREAKRVKAISDYMTIITHEFRPPLIDIQ